MIAGSNPDICRPGGNALGGRRFGEGSATAAGADHSAPPKQPPAHHLRHH